MRKHRQKRFTELEICFETKTTIESVFKCPENDTVLQERSLTKKCHIYRRCFDEPLVYHCVRFGDKLVEVCAPRNLITGSCCAVFDDGIGRVVEDYFNPCLDCPFIYQSDDVIKYPNCLKSTSTRQSTYRRLIENTTVVAKTISTRKIRPTSDLSDYGPYDEYRIKYPETDTFNLGAGNETQQTWSDDKNYAVYSFSAVPAIILIICVVITIKYVTLKDFSRCCTQTKDDWI